MSWLTDRAIPDQMQALAEQIAERRLREMAGDGNRSNPEDRLAALHGLRAVDALKHAEHELQFVRAVLTSVKRGLGDRDDEDEVLPSSLKSVDRMLDAFDHFYNVRGDEPPRGYVAPDALREMADKGPDGLILPHLEP